jgi:GxxExxY protein
MIDLVYKNEVYTVVGICMEVQKVLGYGFSEVIYKDAMEQEFIDNEINYARENELFVKYKNRILIHKFKADFMLFDTIIVEVKACADGITNDAVAQTLNYLKAAHCRVGLIANFGRTKFEYKRLVM